MNIIIKKHTDALCSTRPDTSWERENKDIWLPEIVDSLSFAPVVFTRIVKAGKSVASKFVGRYYEGINLGVLLCPEHKNGQGYSERIECVDHTTLLPHPLYNICVLENRDNEFALSADDEVIFRLDCGKELLDKIEAAICEASSYISLRIGDYIAVELQEETLLTDSRKEIHINACFCENETLDYKIKF